MELVIVSQNYQFQHYTFFHEAKVKSSRTGRGQNARGRVRGQGQIFEAEAKAEDKILAQNFGLEDSLASRT